MQTTAAVANAVPADDGHLKAKVPTDSRRRFLPGAFRNEHPESTPRLLGLARLWGVDRRALAVRARLHLPCYAGDDGRVSYRAAATVVIRNAARLRKDQRAVRDLIPRREYALSDLEFRQIGADADRVFNSLHYLRNARRGSLNFALVDRKTGAPLTLCSASPLEWKRVADQVMLQAGVSQEAIWDLSRVYSFTGAPPNAVSYMLAQVRKYFQRRSDVELLTTAVDPNLGFTGSSYLASNWQQWMTVQARPYLYYKGRYMSIREMRASFPTIRSIDELCKAERHATRSYAPLQDSLIFCCRVRGATEAVPPENQARILR
ncbi:hypothetical protein [Kribbella sindirgiensis]|uniref:Uncharacterized protein n=1 Tax=Kribbella sindirgiensis TaxID=1124744 RepID=A0A4V2M2T3_9ACTN|nr:hypothetical protein [Kribbella sindirgiensis]TCC29362.1 hypothetical protein E0H50_27555 [Kribbella sindirgiensis]